MRLRDGSARPNSGGTSDPNRPQSKDVQPSQLSTGNKGPTYIRVNMGPSSDDKNYHNVNTNSMTVSRLMQDASKFGIKNYNNYEDFYRAPMKSFATGKDAYDYFKQYYSEISNFGYDVTPDRVNQEVGFVPTYWESAQRIGRLYNAMQVLPEDATPSWMDRDFVSTMYNYYSEVYSGKPWWEWSQTVHPDDPARVLLQSMPLPPSSFMLPSEQAYYRDAKQYEAEQADYANQLAIYNEFKTKADAEGKTVDQVYEEYLAGQELVAGSVPKYIWDTLPTWQKVVMRTIPVLSALPLTVVGATVGSIVAPGAGTVAGAAAGAGASLAVQKYLEDQQKKMAAGEEYDVAAMKAMEVLNWPADQVESVIGLALQAGYSLGNPDEYGSLQELLDDFRNTYNAGRYTYDMLLAKAAYDDKSYGVMSSQLGNPEDVYMPLGEGQMPEYYLPQAEAYKYIREQLKTKSMDDVAVDVQRMFGFKGTAIDLIGHVVLDPIDYLLPASVNEVVKLSAKFSGNDLLKVAFETSTGPMAAIKKYKAIANISGDVDKLKDTSWLNKFILDIDATGNKKWLVKSEDTSNWLGGVKAFFGLTPEARSSEAIRNFATNLSIIVKNTDMTPEEVFDFIDALKLSDENVIANMSTNHPWLKSPDGAATVFMLRDYDAAGKIMETYRATRPYYDYLSDMSKALGMEPEDLLSKMNDDSIEALFKSAIDNSVDDDALSMRLKTSATNPSKQMTVDELIKIKDVFTKGTAPAPFDASAFKTQVYTSLVDHANDWAVKWFNVKPDPWAIRMSQALKSAQSWLLLGTNPNFMMNNLVDDIVKMAWTNVLDFKSQKAIDKFWGETIGFTPERLAAGVTAVGDQVLDLTSGVRAATKVKGNDMPSVISKFFNKKFFKSTGVFGNVSQKIESLSSQQAWTKGTMKALAQIMQPGVGFDKLSPELIEQATRLGLNVDTVYSAVKSGKGTKFVSDLVNKKVIEIDVDSSLPRVVENLNKAGFRTNVADVKSMLNELGLDDMIDDAVKGADTSEAVHGGFAKVRKAVQDKLDNIIIDNEEEIMSRATSRVVAEGGQALFDIFDDMNSMGHDFRIQNFDDWERVVSAADTLDGDARDALVKLQSDAMTARYQRMQSLNEAKLRGMLRGMDVSDDTMQAIIGKYKAVNSIWDGFYNTKSGKLDKYFSSKLTGEKRKAAWYKTNSSMVDDYIKASTDEEKLLKEMDALLSSASESQVKGSGKSVMDWLDIRRNAIVREREMMKGIQTKLLDASNAAERRSIWHSFMDDYKKMTIQNRIESNEAGKRIFGARDESVRPSIEFKTINDMQYSMRVHNISDWSEWRDTFRKLNTYLDDTDVPFTEFDYLVSPSQEWWEKFKKAINLYDSDPAELNAPTMFTTNEGVSWIPRSQVRKTFAKQMKQVFNIDKDKVDDILMMSDARAAVWANENISTVDEWYATHIGGVVSGETNTAGNVVLKQTSSPVNPFFSRVKKAVDTAPFESASPSKWKSVLLQSSKKEEMIWDNLYYILDALDENSKIPRKTLQNILEKEMVKYDYDVFTSSPITPDYNYAGLTKYNEYILPTGTGERPKSYEFLGYMNKYGYGATSPLGIEHYAGVGRDKPIYTTVRASDRMYGGKKTLFVEEIQSDLVSKMKKRNKDAVVAGQTSFPSVPLMDEWQNISVKTAIDFAVKQGYDSISFATSNTPTSMWSTDSYGFRLTDQGYTFWAEPVVYMPQLVDDVDELARFMTEDPLGADYTFSTGSAGDIPVENITPDSLYEWVRGNVKNRTDEDVRNIADELYDAYVQGFDSYSVNPRRRGMVQNYDKNVPDYLKKYAKQNGLAEPQLVPMENQIKIVQDEDGMFRYEFESLQDAGTLFYMNFKTEEDARKYLDGIYSGYTIDLTDQFKNKILNDGQPLAQRAGETVKGQVSFNPADGKAIIQAFESADLSTAVHELAHIFRRDLPDFAINKIKDWLSSEYDVDVNYNAQLGYFLPNGQTIDGMPSNVWAEEMFARTYERWLRTGAPVKLDGVSDDMIKVFDDFKEWMTSIYQNVSGSELDVKTNDDIKDVFEYMIDLKAKNTPTAKMYGDEVTDPTRFLPGIMNTAGSDGLGNELDNPVSVKKMNGDNDSMFFHKIENGENKGKIGTYVNGELYGWMTDDHFNSLQWMDSANGKYRVLGVSAKKDGYLIQLENNDLVVIPFKAQGSISTPQVVKAPLGAIDENQPAPPLSEIMYDGMETNVVPVLEELENVMADQPLHEVNGDIPADFVSGLQDYFGKASGQVEQSKLAAVKVGETLRDYALLDYSKQYGFDKISQIIFPYNFWYTRTALNWLMRFVDSPRILANYMRLRGLSQHAQVSGFPTRLENKVAIPLPFTQTSWSGDSMWVDPLRQVFSFEQYLQPFKYKKEEERRLEYTTVNVINRMFENDQISEEEADAAITSKAGSVWDTAYQQAVNEVEPDMSNPYDFMSAIISPSLPLNWAVKFATGQQSDISQLPLVRTIQSITGILGIGDRGVNIGKGLREQLDMPAVDKWDDYRVARQLSNMVGDGSADVNDAIDQMVNKSGPLYEQALSDVGKSQGWRQMLATLAADFFPEGEQTQRQRYEMYSSIFDTATDPTSEAYSKMMEMMPELEARTMSMKSQEDMVRQYMISNIWDKYNELQPKDKQRVRDALGTEFSEKMINKTTRDYDSISNESLAFYSRSLGSRIPDQLMSVPSINIELSAPDVSDKVKDYYEQSNKLFPNIDAKMDASYSQLGELPMFDSYLSPVDEYNKWKNAYLAENPEIIPEVIGESNTLYGLPNDIQATVYQYRALRDQVFPDIFDVQDEYFNSGMTSRQKRSFLLKHQELVKYWEFRRSYASENPKASPYILGDESLSGYISKDEDSSTKVLLDASMFNPLLLSSLTGYFHGGDDLGPGSVATLQSMWSKLGEPYNNFEAWLQLDVRPVLSTTE